MKRIIKTFREEWFLTTLGLGLVGMAGPLGLIISWCLMIVLGFLWCLLIIKSTEI